MEKTQYPPPRHSEYRPENPDRPRPNRSLPRNHQAEDQECNAGGASEEREPQGGRSEEASLRPLPEQEQAEQEDEAERSPTEHREVKGETGRSRPNEPENSAHAHEDCRESIGIQSRGLRLHARWCIRRRSPSNGFRLGGISTPGSSTFSDKPWSRFLFQTSALKARSPSVKSAREAGMPSRGRGKRSACTLPSYTDRQILSVENGVTGARSRRRSRRHAWSVHRAPVSPSYARAFTIST